MNTSLRKRLTSALFMIPFTLATLLYMPSICIVSMLVVVSAILSMEFYRMMNLAGIPAFRYVGISCGTALLFATYFGLVLGVEDGSPGNAGRAAELQVLVLCTSVFAVLIRQFPQRYNNKPLSTMACTLLGILYVPFLLSFFINSTLTWDVIRPSVPFYGRTPCYMVFYSVLVIKFADAGAYFVGRSFGRHKAFPRLSPNKSWEGYIGGVVIATIVGCLFLTCTGWRLGTVVVPPPHGIA